jgi:hypothetical protein
MVRKLIQGDDLAFDLIIDEPFVALMRGLSTGASMPITAREMLLRWLAKGLSHDMMKPEHEAAQMLNQFVRIIRK